MSWVLYLKGPRANTTYCTTLKRDVAAAYSPRYPWEQQRQWPAIHYLGDSISESCLSDIYDMLPWQLFLFWIPFLKNLSNCSRGFLVQTTSPDSLSQPTTEMSSRDEETMNREHFGHERLREMNTLPVRGPWDGLLHLYQLPQAQCLSPGSFCSSSGGQKFNIGKSCHGAHGLEGEPMSSPSLASRSHLLSQALDAFLESQKHRNSLSLLSPLLSFFSPSFPSIFFQFLL